ncbi:MAG TPA: LamG-like jellyroll fold domain-containing protein [Planctomycetota bacterium]|jgi:alpha-galactosidase
MKRFLSILLFVSVAACAGETVSPDELKQNTDWVQQNLLGANAPFSFIYGAKPSSALLSAWEKSLQSNKLDAQRTEHVLTYTDKASGLSIRCRAIEYHDFPTVEWTLYFKNTGAADSPIIENIQALDLKLNRTAAEEFLLHYHTGDNCSAKSYEPHVTKLDPNFNKRFAPAGGRGTNGAYPYYNIEYDDGGVIAVIGWPGQWSSNFQRDGASGLRITGGQELTRFKLLPGEEVRSPLIVLQFWKGVAPASVPAGGAGVPAGQQGGWIRAQNIWRRWMIAHNLPRTGGKLPPPFTSSCMGLHQSEVSEKGYIDAFLKGGVKLDYWWMDAGWYPCKDWWQVGTWEPDPARFPKGIRPVSDYAHSKGMKLVLWFEPERVHPDTWLHKNHPEWLLKNQLFNLGNLDARKWMTEHIDTFINEQGIDLYRQDFNMDPLSHWRTGEPDDRKGIQEIKHVEGYLAFWDELRKRHPDMLIDSCASGGRRNDLETLRRSLPLLRSDFQAPQNMNDRTMLVGNQGHTYGLSFWVPYYGTGVFYNDVYGARSHLTPAMGLGFSGESEKVDWPAFQRRVADWKAVADYFYGDYYPLTPYSLSENDWIAWQFNGNQNRDREGAAGEGFIQAFRRAQAPEASMRLKLHSLDANAVYDIRNLDVDGISRGSGRALMEPGLLVRLASRRQAALITYKRVNMLAAVIFADADTAEVLQPLNFSGKDSCAPNGAIASYAWDFGDGSTGNGPTIEHAYKAAGSFTVKLTVKDAQGATDAISLALDVKPADTTPPAVIAVASGHPERVVVTFSEPVEQTSAEAIANYSIDHDVKVTAASLEPSLSAVTLTVSPLAEKVDYTLSVSNVKDRSRSANAIAAGAKQTFRYSGLYAHWRLDDGQGEIAVDSSGNGHHGTLMGGPAWVVAQTVKPAKALSFDGVDDLLESNTYLSDMDVPFSITLWVNPAAKQMEHADIFGNHGEPFLGISLQQDGTKLNSYGFGCGDGKRWQGAGPVQLKADEWQHVAIVCDGQSAFIYVNGSEQAKTPASGPLKPNRNQNFKLGQGYHTGRYFRGLLSDVRIYRKALLPADVLELAKPKP